METVQLAWTASEWCRTEWKCHLFLTATVLGHPFKLVTNHAPLQWLSAQKVEGLLYRWLLALQECKSTVVYRKGSLNVVADSLSQCFSRSSHTASWWSWKRRYTMHNIAIQQLAGALHSSSAKPRGRKWHRSPLFCYWIWNQLDHQGVEKTLEHLHQQAYWINM